jgi:hypothetical protein
MRLRILALLAAATALSGCATEVVTSFSDDRNWQIAESPHFIFHYRAGSQAERDIAKIAAAAETDYVAVTTALNIQLDAVINYYIYPPEEASSIGQQPGGAHADPRTLAIYQTYSSGGTLGRHEMVHIIAEHGVGHANLQLLVEGTAVALAGSYGTRPIDDWIRPLWQRNSLLAVRDMLDKPNDYAERDFYPEAGSFVRYLLTRYGTAPFKQLYVATYDDFDSEFFRLYDHSLEDVERDYRQSLDVLFGPR